MINFIFKLLSCLLVIVIPVYIVYLFCNGIVNIISADHTIKAICPQCGHALERYRWEMKEKSELGMDEPISPMQKEGLVKLLSEKPFAIPVAKKMVEDGVLTYRDISLIHEYVYDKNKMEQERLADKA